MTDRAVRLEDPPPIKTIGRGLSEHMKKVLRLCEKHPGKWVRVGEYGTPGSARSKGITIRKYGLETTARGCVLYARQP